MLRKSWATWRQQTTWAREWVLITLQRRLTRFEWIWHWAVALRALDQVAGAALARWRSRGLQGAWHTWLLWVLRDRQRQAREDRQAAGVQRVFAVVSAQRGASAFSAWAGHTALENARIQTCRSDSASRMLGWWQRVMLKSVWRRLHLACRLEQKLLGAGRLLQVLDTMTLAAASQSVRAAWSSWRSDVLRQLRATRQAAGVQRVLAVISAQRGASAFSVWAGHTALENARIQTCRLDAASRVLEWWQRMTLKIVLRRLRAACRVEQKLFGATRLLGVLQSVAAASASRSVRAAWTSWRSAIDVPPVPQHGADQAAGGAKAKVLGRYIELCLRRHIQARLVGAWSQWKLVVLLDRRDRGSSRSMGAAMLWVALGSLHRKRLRRPFRQFQRHGLQFAATAQEEGEEEGEGHRGDEADNAGEGGKASPIGSTHSSAMSTSSTEEETHHNPAMVRLAQRWK